MKRVMMIAAALALLALPIGAVADETVIPPEANWTPTPPARVQVDAEQLMRLLVKKGVISPVEQAELTRPAARGYRQLDRNDAAEYVSQP